jgi:LysM repeat protein
MKKTAYLLIALGFFTSCSAHRALVSNSTARQNNREVQGGSHYSPANYTSLTSLQYLDKYKDIAIQEMNSFGIPASITLAQGLYESGAGNSELARVANNHFGVKAGLSWSGKVYYKDDDNRNDAFRVYGSAEESYRDHSSFLKKKNYAFLFQLDITDYKGWARGLKQAGYATNPQYPQIIINIIEKYNLQQYDQSGYVQPQPVQQAAVPVTPVQNNPVPVTPVQSNPAPADTTAGTSTQTGDKTYTVKQGDTLYGISRRFGLLVDDLKALNNLTDNNIKIGQVLTIAK